MIAVAAIAVVVQNREDTPSDVSKRDPDMVTARTRGAKPVHVRGTWEPGTIFDVIIERGAPHHLVGSTA